MFRVFKNTQFCLLCIVVLSVLEFNLCSSFLCQSRWGLWMMALFHPRSQGHIFKVIVEQQNSISFLVCVVYLYSVWRWKICCPVKWHFWYWVSVQDQKNGRILSCLCWQQQKIPRETSSLTSIFLDGISKRFCYKIDNGRSNPF